MLPIFAYGSSFDYTLPDEAAAYQTTYVIVDADLYINVGDSIFISKADNSEPEYLGPVTNVDSSSIVTKFGPKILKDAGAKLWIPDKVFLFSIAPEPPVRLPVETGVETLITTGGRVIQTRVSDPVFREELRFNNISQSAYADFSQWLEDGTDWGLFAFHYVDSRRVVCFARLEKTPVIRAESEPGLFSLAISLIVKVQL